MSDVDLNNQILEKKRRKRGRPKKNDGMTEQTESENEIILELPISMNDLEKYCVGNGKDLPETEKKKTRKSKNIFVLNELSSSSPLVGKDNDYQQLKLQLTDKDIEINRLKKEVAKLKKLLDENGMHGTSNVKVYELRSKLISFRNGKQIIPERTKIACWWCTEQFNNKPFFLPEKYENEKYHVVGCFCSPNCCSSYNFYTINDYRVWDRYSLLKEMYTTHRNIINAPPKEVLAKYGGIDSIKEYRKKMMIGTKEYHVIYPPMTSITPIVEERTVNGRIEKVYDNNMSDNFGGLKLKRSKPLPSTKSTLVDTMGLRIKNKS